MEGEREGGRENGASDRRREGWRDEKRKEGSGGWWNISTNKFLIKPLAPVLPAGGVHTPPFRRRSSVPEGHAGRGWQCWMGRGCGGAGKALTWRSW